LVNLLAKAQSTHCKNIIEKMKDFSIVFVKESKQFFEMLDFIELFEEISIDMEADGFYAYKAKPCLWQLCVEDEAKKYVFLVDPVLWKGKDPLPMQHIFGNDQILKIFHGSEYDFQMIYETYSIVPKNIEDTKIAADLLGCPSPGLDTLLNDFLDIKVNKSKRLQRANWAKRPLTEELVDYAALDVLHLKDLRGKLINELEEKGRLKWYLEECFLYQNSNPVIQDEITKEHSHKIKGAKKLSKSQLAILEILFETRESICSKKNLASFRLIGNQQLLDIAKNYEGYKDVFPKRMDFKIKKKFIKSIDLMKASKKPLPIFSPPKKKKYKKGPDHLTKAIREMRLKKSEKLNILPGVLLPARILNAIALSNPKNLNELKNVNGVRKWQAELLGESILNAIDKV
tara:strand:+ start:3311 stop:4513 length:1203 start_codon:yes stop_codon:yes gene_type:complete